MRPPRKALATVGRPTATSHTRALVKPSLNPAPLVAKSLATLEKEVGGREMLVAGLLHAPASEDLSFLLGLLGDPLNAKEPIAKLCALSGGIKPGEMLDAYKAGELNRAQAVATSRIGKSLAAVAEDTMRRSLPHEQICAVCTGTGTQVPEPSKAQPNPTPAPCPACRGTGQTPCEGDIEHKKLALDMGKLLQKGGGPLVNVNQQVGMLFGTTGGALEQLQAATDQILYGDQPVGPPEESPAEIDTQEAILEGDWREEGQP